MIYKQSDGLKPATFPSLVLYMLPGSNATEAEGLIHIINNIVAAFRGMHVSAAKHSSVRLQKSVTIGQIGFTLSAYVPLYFAGDTINCLFIFHLDLV